MVVNVFLLRSRVTRFDDAIDPASGATEFTGAAGLPFQCKFYLSRAQPHPPTWAEFIDGHLARPLPRVVQSSVSGVLVLKGRTRFFAVTFGRGRFLLAGGAYEEDFGLKVTLNRVDSSDLKSIDTKTYDEIVTSSKIQVSRDSGIENFGVDIARDILRAVQGRPKDQNFATRLAGADAVSIARPGLKFEQLQAVCEELLSAYGETAYRNDFKWVDNIRPVRDDATLRLLEGALAVALQTSNLGNMHLCLMDESADSEIVAYQFTLGRKGEFRNLELNAYLNGLGAKVRSLDCAMLKNHRVKIRYSGAADFDVHATIYESLVWETTISGQTYALFDGRWFCVSRDFCKEVEDYWRGLVGTAYPLPNAGLDEDEQGYNSRATQLDAGLALFDRVRFAASSQTSPVEYCDLMSDKGHLIHVKRRYTSATFSHHFSQGTVSIETFINDPEYRKQICDHLKSQAKTNHLALVPPGTPVASKFELVYAVIAPARAAKSLLPFFSAVNLRQHGTRLSTSGIKLTLQHILAA